MPNPSHLIFRKSSYSGPRTENCVEVAAAHSAAAVRDSQNPQQRHLLFGAAEWRAFLEGIKHDDL